MDGQLSEIGFLWPLSSPPLRHNWYRLDSLSLCNAAMRRWGTPHALQLLLLLLLLLLLALHSSSSLASLEDTRTGGSRGWTLVNWGARPALPRPDPTCRRQRSSLPAPISPVQWIHGCGKPPIVPAAQALALELAAAMRRNIQSAQPTPINATSSRRRPPLPTAAAPTAARSKRWWQPCKTYRPPSSSQGSPPPRRRHPPPRQQGQWAVPLSHPSVLPPPCLPTTSAGPATAPTPVS